MIVIMTAEGWVHPLFDFEDKSGLQDIVLS